LRTSISSSANGAVLGIGEEFMSRRQGFAMLRRQRP
jgi:hypothetical protein